MTIATIIDQLLNNIKQRIISPEELRKYFPDELSEEEYEILFKLFLGSISIEKAKEYLASLSLSKIIS